MTLKNKLFIVALLSVAILSFCHIDKISAAPAPSKHIKFNITRPAVREIADITYVQHFNWPVYRLKMDILKPESNEPLPAVLFITGGGFVAAAKTTYIQQRVHLAEAGYVVASVEYRIVPNTYKDALQDIKAAIRYLRAHAKEFNIDPNRIAVMGESAGGYLAAMVGVTNDINEFDVGDNLNQSSAVQAVVDIYGLSDLTKVGADYSAEVQEAHKSAGATEALFVNGVALFSGTGGGILSNPESAKAANPITYISANTPPFLLMHGDKDSVVSPSQTELLHTALCNKGIDSTRYVVESANHADHYWNQPEVEIIIIDFLNRVLKN
ncbi:MAG: alpha/beta hydrolase [Selenomonadaceae bacterium]|nr:alpha/beta hydrolase [Selenomonadaceae bacterium]